MIQHGVARWLVTVCFLSVTLLGGYHAASALTAQKIDPPKIIKHVEPVYPPSAQAARIQGVVVVEATIGTDGKVRTVKVVQSIPLLDEAALTAVRQWEYTPTIVNGVATPVIMTVKVNFALKESAGDRPAAPSAVPKPQPAAPMSPQVQREWEKVWEAASKLALDDKITEAIAAVNKFLARNATVAEAHYQLANFYEMRTGFSSPPNAAQRSDLENAAKHYVRVGELLSDEPMRFVILWKLTKLYGADQLNDAVQAERYARRMVQEHPTRHESHMVYAQLLREKGDIAGAADVMRKGRAVSTMPVPGLFLALQYPIEQVQASRELSPDAARALLGESIAAADAILAHPEKDERDYRMAAMGKGLALEVRAERVAQSRQERIALLEEADRWVNYEKHKNGVPPPARKLTAAETNDLEWQALQRWNNRLADEGNLAAAIAAYERYLGERPTFGPGHQALADLLIRIARDATETSTRTSRLEQAAVHLERVIELATTPEERDDAFSRVLELYGPTQLNRPALEETAARTMVKRQPTARAGHYALAAVLLRSGRSAEADKVLRGARAAIKPTPSSRAAMARELVRIIQREESWTLDSASRLFDEAGALLTEAEKLNSNALDVIVARSSWLNLSADKFEKDPARAAAQRGQAKQLMIRAEEISAKTVPKPK